MTSPSTDVVVFDVLGTLVDEPSGLRAGLRRSLPDVDERRLDDLVTRWATHVEIAHSAIERGARAFVPSDILNLEAAELVLASVGAGDAVMASDLVAASLRLPPWPDSQHGLLRLSGRYPVIGLSNACPAELVRLNAHAGLRFHLALSAALVAAYKPDPRVYRLAADAAGVPAERLLMVAAHAWDLRGARAVGLRTAYVERPAGDPPAHGERFDLHAGGLDDLADQLGV